MKKKKAEPIENGALYRKSRRVEWARPPAEIKGDTNANADPRPADPAAPAVGHGDAPADTPPGVGGAALAEGCSMSCSTSKTLRPSVFLRCAPSVFLTFEPRPARSAPTDHEAMAIIVDAGNPMV